MEAHVLLIIRDVKIQRDHRNEKVEKKNQQQQQTNNDNNRFNKQNNNFARTRTILYISLLSLMHD